MQNDWDAVSARAVALVTAMSDRFDGDSDGPPAPDGRVARVIEGRQCVVRLGQMITDGLLDGGTRTDWFVGALGLLAARAAEDLATVSGEPMALWLERWLSQPYGAPACGAGVIPAAASR